MNVKSPNNASTSAGASSSALAEHEHASEQAFLHDAVHDARDAVAQTLDDLKESLGHAADWRLWTRQHPLAAVGIAAAAGFAAAAALTPGKDETLGDKLSRMAGTDESAATEDAPREASERQGPSTMNKLITSLFDLAKVGVETSLLAAVRAAAENRQSPDTAAPDHEAEPARVG